MYFALRLLSAWGIYHAMRYYLGGLERCIKFLRLVSRGYCIMQSTTSGKVYVETTVEPLIKDIPR